MHPGNSPSPSKPTLYPKDDPDKAEILTATIGEESHFHEAFGIYADGVSETTSILPDGWRERLVKIQDIQFTAAMVGYGMVEPAAFRERLGTIDLTPEHRKRIVARFSKQMADAASSGHKPHLSDL